MADDLPARLQALDAYTLADAGRRLSVGAVVDRLRPVTAARQFAGRALTATIAYDPAHPVPLVDYGVGPLLDRVGPGHVLVLDGGGLALTALGDLAMAMLKRRGAAAAVVNARVRDVEEIDRMGFAVFAVEAGITTLAGHARIVGIGEPVALHGVPVSTGDLVAGCAGGLFAAPWREAAALVEAASRIAESDRRVLDGIEAGEALAELWKKHKNLG